MKRIIPSERFISCLCKQLQLSSEHAEALHSAIINGDAARPAIVWLQHRPADWNRPNHPSLPWQPDWIDAPLERSQLGSNPLHEEGAYYLLDFSSVCTGLAVMATPHQPKVVVDVCASPGGKSILAWRALSPELIIANEVIGKRTGALISNLTRCHITPSQVTRLDPERLVPHLRQAADLVLVDAPCSGQSLVARGIDAPGAFNPVTVNANANRQKRILANAAELVAPGGYLTYTTCTYSLEENEGVTEWLTHKFPNLTAITVPHLEDYRSSNSPLPCYKFFPFHTVGAGGFVVVFHNTETHNGHTVRVDELPTVWPHTP